MLLYAVRLSNLAEVYYAKKARHKRPCMTSFHLYEMSRAGTSKRTESRLQLLGEASDGE